MVGNKWLLAGLACLAVVLTIQLGADTPPETEAAPEVVAEAQPIVDATARLAIEESQPPVVVDSDAEGGEAEVSVDPRTSTIDDVINQAVPTIMDLPDVVGIAEGRCEGAPCVKVYMAKENPATEAQIPAEIDGFQVIVEYHGQPKAGM